MSGNRGDQLPTDQYYVADAVTSFRAGAKNYINKRLIRELLIPKIKTLIGRDDDDNFPLLFSRKSDGYLRAYSAAHVVAPTNLNVMIIGESGVGKEPLAHEIYDMSQQCDRPCVLMDCGTLHYLALNNNTKQQPTLIIATASPDISEMVIEGGFLSALFYKIKEFTIVLPSLRGHKTKHRNAENL